MQHARGSQKWRLHYLRSPIAPFYMSDRFVKETECGGCGLSLAVYGCAHGAPLNFDYPTPWSNSEYLNYDYELPVSLPWPWTWPHLLPSNPGPKFDEHYLKKTSLVNLQWYNCNYDFMYNLHTLESLSFPIESTDCNSIPWTVNTYQIVCIILIVYILTNS